MNNEVEEGPRVNSSDTKTESINCIKQEKTVEEKSKEEEPDKCPVCLQKFRNSNLKSYTSKCFHSFCFECILEWSKVKYCCPLCKTEFDRILYDVKSRLEFKEHMLKPREIETSNVDIISIFPNTPFQPLVTISRASWHVSTEQAPLEFRIMIYVKNWYVNPNQIQTDAKITNIELEISENSENNAQENIVNDNLACISYKSVDRFRNVKPEWFRNNPACAHRLMPFLYRELKTLAGIVPSYSTDRLGHTMRSQLISIIINLIKKIDINSEDFYKEISQHIRPLKYARHFQHELYAFAKSTCADLIEYDSKCVYYNDLNQIPTNNDLLSENPKIIPFNSLPINLSKYRLVNKIENPYSLINYYDEFETIQPHTSQNQPSTSASFLNQENSEQEIRTERSISISDSEHSSYCEIVTPPQKKTPPIICITTSESEDENFETESIQLVKSTRSSKSQILTSAQMNSLDNDQPRTSRDMEFESIQKNKTRDRDTSTESRSHKHKKHKKKHKKDKHHSKKSKKSKRDKKDNSKHKSKKHKTRSRSSSRNRSRSRTRERNRSSSDKSSNSK